MFLFDESYRLKNFGYYVLGSFILILFSTIGQIPLLFFLPSELPAPDASAMDLFQRYSFKPKAVSPLNEFRFCSSSNLVSS